MLTPTGTTARALLPDGRSARMISVSSRTGLALQPFDLSSGHIAGGGAW